ncbi:MULTISPECIES: LytTR family DNA-binding domain-containing protein [Flectobacillus]|jgi:DNA-binding LytR/AlgR family response regulator|uniref:LytR/AlgR family response regulator transcription factor n=1 Tax=Flectobacillus TaxID=101 RepID=UPI000BA48F66|nr:response regulator transcription factor [Flectobacillus sp. BAB-3569]NBA78724.1 response regulator [Emticicia sp. ODNR4P]PAC26780.1 DNA-binding response regulator [Flectobacillus sp. BAB-3569]
MNSKVILIVEDDFLNRRLTKKILQENSYQVLEAKNAGEALAILNKEWVDLIILDINLGEGEMDGISLGSHIQNKQKVPFIYLTAYENTNIISEAVATSPYSYLTKPFKNSDLIASIELALIKSSKEDKPKPSILVKDGEYKVELLVEDINFINSEGNYLLFYTNDKTFKSRATISQILELLPPSKFIQIHRAFIVNKDKIEKYNTKNVVIKNTIIPLSKKDLFDR